MRYVAFGIPGVGKTSVIDQVLRKTGIQHVHFGDLFMEKALKFGWVKNRDELRGMDIRKTTRLQVSVAKDVVDEYEGQDILIETHAAVKGGQGYLPGFTHETLKELKPNVFIVIEAAPEIIFERRMKDETRWRKDDVTIEQVRLALDMTKWYASTFAVLSGASVFIVENKQGDMEYAADRICELIKHGKSMKDTTHGAI